MGMVGLMDQAEQGKTKQKYTFSLQAMPDALSGPLVAGKLDIAAVPVNLAAVLFNKTHGGVKVAAVNTLGVLYAISGDPEVTQLSDLAGKTVSSTGKGTTPQETIDEVLAAENLTDSVTVDYRSQPTEVASIMATTPNDIAILPEPYVTSVMSANPKVHIVADLNDAWQKAVGSPLVAGCIIVRTDFLKEHPDAVKTFMGEYADSVKFVNDHPDQAAPLIVKQGIVPDVATAQKAIPRANIVDMTGADSQKAIDAYLQVLFKADPTSVGGSVPGDDFYYGN
jgi:NitT/TauT family transport system substrate-binding protein